MIGQNKKIVVSKGLKANAFGLTEGSGLTARVGLMMIA